MTPHTMPQTVLFPDLFDKPLVATFNQEHASSDGGAVLLKPRAESRRNRLGQGVRPVFGRQARRRRTIRHDVRGSMIGQRIFGIACGSSLMATMPTTWPTTPSTSC